MVTLLFSREMERPVRLHVAARDERAKTEDGFGTRERPARTGAIHAVLDEVASSALDDAGGDGEAVADVRAVVHEGAKLLHVARGALEGPDLVEARLEAAHRAQDVCGDLVAATALQKPHQAGRDPSLAV